MTSSTRPRRRTSRTPPGSGCLPQTVCLKRPDRAPGRGSVRSVRSVDPPQRARRQPFRRHDVRGLSCWLHLAHHVGGGPSTPRGHPSTSSGIASPRPSPRCSCPRCSRGHRVGARAGSPQCAALGRDGADEPVSSAEAWSRCRTRPTSAAATLERGAGHRHGGPLVGNHAIAGQRPRTPHAETSR